MNLIKKGSWVQIENIILKVGERADDVPEETKNVPLKVFQKGYLQDDAQIGEEVTIRTIIGRTIEGKLIANNPKYNHDFGRPITELLSVGKEFRELINWA